MQKAAILSYCQTYWPKKFILVRSTALTWNLGWGQKGHNHSGGSLDPETANWPHFCKSTLDKCRKIHKERKLKISCRFSYRGIIFGCAVVYQHNKIYWIFSAYVSKREMQIRKIFFSPTLKERRQNMWTSPQEEWYVRMQQQQWSSGWCSLEEQWNSRPWRHSIVISALVVFDDFIRMDRACWCYNVFCVFLVLCIPLQLCICP